MSVSLPPAPATLANQAAKPLPQNLVLTVINKTDALLTKLVTLNTSKPVALQVLQAAPNGRAQVQAGSLQVDVKSAIPLKKGDTIHAKLEQQGSALRFVQTINTPQQSADAKSLPTQNQAGKPTAQQAPQTSLNETSQLAPALNTANRKSQTIARTGTPKPAPQPQTTDQPAIRPGTQPPSSKAPNAAPSSNPPATPKASQPPHTSSSTNTNQAGPKVTVANQQPVPSSQPQTAPTGPRVATTHNQPTSQPHQSQTAPNTSTTQNQPNSPANTATQTPHTLNRSGNVTTNQVTPQQPTGQETARPQSLSPITTSPARLPIHQQSTTAQRPTPQAALSTPSPPSNPLLSGQQTISTILQAIVDPKFQVNKKDEARTENAAKPSGKAEIPQAKSNDLTRAIDRFVEATDTKAKQIQASVLNDQPDNWEKPKPNGLDLQLELPVRDNKEAANIHLNIWPDDKRRGETGSDQTWIVQFSVDANHTGPVYVQARYLREMININLWAESAEFAETLQANSDELENSLEAQGLDLNALTIRKGKPFDHQYGVIGKMDKNI